MPPGMLSSSVAANPSAVRIRSGRMTPGSSCLKRFWRASLTICSGLPRSRYSAMKARRRSARAAVVQIVERAVEAKKIGA